MLLYLSYLPTPTPPTPSYRYPYLPLPLPPLPITKPFPDISTFFLTPLLAGCCCQGPVRAGKSLSPNNTPTPSPCYLLTPTFSPPPTPKYLPIPLTPTPYPYLHYPQAAAARVRFEQASQSLNTPTTNPYSLLTLPPVSPPTATPTGSCLCPSAPTPTLTLLIPYPYSSTPLTPIISYSPTHRLPRPGSGSSRRAPIPQYPYP